MDLTIGTHRIDVDIAVKLVKEYCTDHRATVLYYDLAGEPNGTVQPSDGIALADIGRMALINPDLSGNDVAVLLSDIAPNVDWTLVPGHARLENAAPGEADGLYERMSTLWTQVRRPHIGRAKASKLLHMKRPFAFPILDTYVMRAYSTRAAQAAADAGVSGPRGGQRALYWPVIREDLRAGRDALAEVRNRLMGEPTSLHRSARLPDLRFIDILAWRVAGPDGAES